MTDPRPIALTQLPDDGKTRRALQDLVSQLTHEGCFGYTFSVSLEDVSFDTLVQILSDEQTDAGPTLVAATAPNWTTLLTITLSLDPTIQYVVQAHGSLDLVATGAGNETADIRVTQSTNGATATTLQSLRGTSVGTAEFIPFAVPAYIKPSIGTSSVVLTLDGQHVATAGNNAQAERIVFFATATPVSLVRPQS